MLEIFALKTGLSVCSYTASYGHFATAVDTYISQKWNRV